MGKDLNHEGGTSGGAESESGPSSCHKQGRENGHASVTIDIKDLDQTWVASIKQRICIERGRQIKEPSTAFPCSIYRVPHCLRQYNDKAYDPQIISIGPFHYEKRRSQLREMEEYKWRYLDDLLSRSGEGSLERCLAAVKELEERARKCYSEVITLDTNFFVEMLVLDACFIIEFHYKIEKNHGHPIFESESLMDVLRTDLLLLENQIPHFVFKRLYELIDVSDPSLFSLEIICSICPFFEKTVVERFKNSKIQHLLHLVHKILIISVQRYSIEEKCDFQRIPCATKLEEGGIKFTETDESDDTIDFLDIKFDEKGVIGIPSIKFWDKANILFLNLIAFEQCYCPCEKYITAYIAFMNCLITTGKDVEILCKEGIIVNWLGTDGDVVALFNNIIRELTVREEDFYLSNVCKRINQHCERTWPKMRTTLVHDYFRNPWAIISFSAALLLLLLTTTQTFFSAAPKFAYGN